MLHKLKACGSSRQKETKKAFCSTEPSNSSSKALSWPTLPSLYDGCASRPDQPEVTPGATVNPPAMPGTPGEEAQLFFFHSGCINSSFVAFWTRLCSKHPGVALCCLQRCLQLKGAPCGCSAVPLGRQFPAPLTRRRALCLWNSCGNRTARLSSPRWRQPRFPSLSGGPTGCAEPQHRLLPARSPEPAISCPVHFNVLRRIGGKNYGFFVCFVFVDESSHTPKAPRPVSPREPVAIARAACWQEPAQASNSGLPAPAML